MHIVVFGLVTILAFTKARYIDDSKTSLKNQLKEKETENVKLSNVIKELNKVYDDCLKRKKISCENELLTVEKRMRMEKMVTPPANGLWGKDHSNKNSPARNVENTSKKNFINNDNRLSEFSDITKTSVEHVSAKNNNEFKTLQDAPRGPPTGGLWGRDFKGVFSSHLLNEKINSGKAMLPRSQDNEDTATISKNEEEEQQEINGDRQGKETMENYDQQQEINGLAPMVNGLWGRRFVKENTENDWEKDAPRNNPKDRFNAGLWGRVLHPEIEKGIQKSPVKVEKQNLINADIVNDNEEQNRPWKWETKKNTDDYQTGLWGKDISDRYKKIRGSMWRRELENKANNIHGEGRLNEENGTKEVINNGEKTSLKNKGVNSKLTRINKPSLDNTIKRVKDRSPRRMYYLRHSDSSYA